MTKDKSGFQRYDCSQGFDQGERLGWSMDWLRWWDRSGNLLLCSAEQSEQERFRAEKLAAKLRELGTNPDALI